MKIALVTPYDCSWPGGVCRHVTGLAGAMRALGHRVITVSPRPAGGGVRAGADSREFGRSVWVTGNGSRARITLDVLQYRAVGAFLRREQFDVVHVHEPYMPVLPALFLLNSKGVNVATWHTYRDTSPWYRLFRPGLARLGARIHGRIAVSLAARDLVHSYFPADYDVIPNGIDGEWFRDDVAALPWARDERPRVLFVGRFDDVRKGFRVLLAAIPAIRQRVPDVEIVVIGPGDASRYRGLSTHAGRAVVRFAGQVPDAELAAWFRSCDLLCSPALGSESFGLILVEAMACGLPVVATDIPGYRSVLTHGREGVLCEAGNPGALASCVADVLTDRAAWKAMGTCGRRSARAYSWSHLAPRVLAVYERAASEAPRHRAPASSREP